MTERNAPRWKTTKWAGHTNYECAEKTIKGLPCPFATLDYGAMVRHARQKHPRAWEGEPAAPGPLFGIDFASDEAAELAAELGLAAVDFGGATPSGKTGFTVADVKAAAKHQEE